jgi:hypothetical protein
VAKDERGGGSKLLRINHGDEKIDEQQNGNDADDESSHGVCS